MSTYQSQPIRFGLQGLVLKPARDLVNPDQATILSNLDNVKGGKLQVRPGQTLLGQAGATVHTIRRLNAQNGASYARFYGIDGNLYSGTTGNPSLVDSGYSGRPLWTVPYRSEIAGDSWLYLADSAKMAKVRLDGTVMPIGLAAPGGAVTAAAGTLQSTTINAMNSAAGWTGYHDSASGAPTVDTSAPSPPSGGAATTLVTNAGTVKAAYTQWMDHALTVDLTQVGALGANSASDGDYIHLWLYMDFPSNIIEIRVFFVTSTFTSGVVPGTSVTQNNVGYWKAFGPGDFAVALAGTSSTAAALTAAERAALNATLGAGIRTPPPGTPSVGTAVARGSTPPSITAPASTGAATWTEFGVVGRPLYRSDFTPFGTSPSWATVNGIVIWVNVAANTVAGALSPNVRVAVNNSYLFGGYGLDDGAIGARNFDWVCTNFDPRTGAESNGSPVMTGQATAPTGTWLDALRGQVTLTPAAPYGNSAVRQRFYRRGGVNIDNWYFTGVNTSDGGTFTDVNTDAFTRGTGLTVPVDHFQPIATVDASGNTVLNQPVAAIWGPVQGMLFACGDPFRPGWLYASKPNEPDHWINAIEVCQGSEQLQAGCVFADRAFVFSTERAYHIIPNLNTGGGLTSLPTACQHGLAGRWGLAVGLHGIYVCARDGIYLTSGGDEGVPLSDDIRPLFDGQTVNGQAPIDFAGNANNIKLRLTTTLLWFLFVDTNGVRACYVYSLLYQTWRRYDFAFAVNEAYLEEGVPGQSVLLGEAAGGTIDTFSGLTDRGTPITWHYRSGALDQGVPRIEKRYGNWAVDLDAGWLSGLSSYTAQAFLNDETTTVAPVVVGTLPGRRRTTFDPFAGATTRARNVSMDLTGSSIFATPTLYLAEIAAASEPADYQLWETDEIDHGIPGWQTPVALFLAVRGLPGTTLTLTRTIYDDLQNQLYPPDTYAVAISAVKSHVYVPFTASKGALYQYRFVTANGAFRIYPDETSMLVQVKGQLLTVRPFATTAAGIQSLNPLLAALRPGGAL